jgi:hypothetical protein
MAEIKSAIELAMERTKNLVMDEKEKQEFARRELEDKLRAIVRRYLEGIIDREIFSIEYAGVQGQKLEKRSLLADFLIHEFSVSAENERLFDVLEMVGDEAGEGFRDEAVNMKREFRKELENRVAEIGSSIKGRLEVMGITGSSVEPNITAWEEWRDAVQEIGRIFARRLHDWKDRIRSVST